MKRYLDTLEKQIKYLKEKYKLCAIVYLERVPDYYGEEPFGIASQTVLIGKSSNGIRFIRRIK